MSRVSSIATVLAVVAVAVVAASISTPVPGSATPDTVTNRSLPEDGGVPTPGGDTGADRPVFTIPGIGVSVPVAFDIPPWLGAALVVGILGVMILGIVRELSGRPTRTTVDPVTPAEGDTDPTDVAGVGAAAGRAADRLLADTDAAVTNEVYRAWREMTSHLDVMRPEASTPREFADAAIDAGLDPDDVADLTTLFERVRYGDGTVSDDDAARVADILRGIETRYAPEPPATTDDESAAEDHEGIPDPWEERNP